MTTEEFANAIFDSSPVGIQIFGKDGTSLRMNEKMRQLIGLSSRDHGVAEFNVLTDPFSISVGYTSLFQRAYSGESLHGHEIEVDLSSPDNRRETVRRKMVLEFDLFPLLDSRGGVCAVVTFMRDITKRHEAEAKLAETHRQLVDASRQAGMAEVAASVLHNVGNVLNSINVSAALVAELVRQSKVTGLRRATDLLAKHGDHLPTYIATDEQGRQLPAFLIRLAQHLNEERDALAGEIASMVEGIERIRTVIATELSYATVGGIEEELSPADLLDDAITLNRDAFALKQIYIEYRPVEVPPIRVDRYKLLQILMHLLSNAGHALERSAARERRLSIRLISSQPDRVRIEIADNGIGIPRENLVKIFAHGFTTKPGSHGFGLHASANAAKEMGGSLTCTSEGPGHGATFALELPVAAGPGGPTKAPAETSRRSPDWHRGHLCQSCHTRSFSAHANPGEE